MSTTTEYYCLDCGTVNVINVNQTTEWFDAQDPNHAYVLAPCTKCRKSTAQKKDVIKKEVKPPPFVYINHPFGDGFCECGSSMIRKYNMFFFRIGPLHCVRPHCDINKRARLWVQNP